MLKLFVIRNKLYIVTTILILALAGCGGGGGSSSGGGGVVVSGGGGGTPLPLTSVSLSWTAPDALSNLGGYRVYYGTSSGNYSEMVDVGTSTSVVINDLTSGTTYYFTVTVYDTSGDESDPSNEVSKTI